MYPRAAIAAGVHPAHVFSDLDEPRAIFIDDDEIDGAAALASQKKSVPQTHEILGTNHFCCSCGLPETLTNTCSLLLIDSRLIARVED